MRATLSTFAATALLVTSWAGRAAAQPPPLEGTSWRLAELPAGVLATLAGKALLPGMSSKITFEPGGVLTGSDGCRPFRGSWSVDGSALTLKQGAANQMACAEIMMRQAAAFSSALASATSYAIDGGQLVLTGAGGARVAGFARVAVAPLQGTVWEAVRINNGKGAAASPVEGTTVTATFGADGSLTGSTGCNQYTGTYETTGNAIKIPPPATTRKACPDPVMAQEREYLTALTRAAQYGIEEDRLDLVDATGARQVVFRAKK